MNTNLNHSDTYGWDNFSKVLIIIGILLFFGGYKSAVVGIVVIGFSFWRTQSRNIFAREKERMYFDKIVYRLKLFIDSVKNKYFSGKRSFNFKNPFTNLKEKSQFIVVKCPFCMQKLRLPRRKGNIIVTCAACKHDFKTKT